MLVHFCVFSGPLIFNRVYVSVPPLQSVYVCARARARVCVCVRARARVCVFARARVCVCVCLFVVRLFNLFIYF